MPFAQVYACEKGVRIWWLFRSVGWYALSPTYTRIFCRHMPRKIDKQDNESSGWRKEQTIPTHWDTVATLEEPMFA